MLAVQLVERRSKGSVQLEGGMGQALRVEVQSRAQGELLAQQLVATCGQQLRETLLGSQCGRAISNRPARAVR
jgi:hypothetical protein